MVFRLGLTGGIGSGKSTVAQVLQSMGAGIVDADAVAHAITAPSGAAINAIRTTFGDAFIDASGALDRARMRALVFSDAAAKRKLESLLHPLIRTACERAEAALAGSSAYVVHVVPLLIESGHWHDRVDRVLVIDCTEATQVERVERRNGWTRTAVLSVIATQATRATRLAAADDVLFNDLSLADLRERAARLHAVYQGLRPAHHA